MSITWPWLALAGLGAYHGLNPAMGWLFAVALGLHRGSRRVVLQNGCTSRLVRRRAALRPARVPPEPGSLRHVANYGCLLSIRQCTRNFTTATATRRRGHRSLLASRSSTSRITGRCEERFLVPASDLASLATFTALFAHLAGERQLKIAAKGGAPNNRTVERELEISRGGSKGFCRAKWIASAILVKILIPQMDQNGGW